MRNLMTTLCVGLVLTACAPADGELTPTEDGPFVADTEAASDPMDDVGFEAARKSVREVHRLDDDLVRKIEDRVVEDPGCDRVAFLAIKWADQGNEYKGTIYSLAGDRVAKARGHFAPVGSDGGVFTGPWSTRPTDDGTHRSGPLGGSYSSDGTFFGQATYRSEPFPLRGVWRRTSKFGGLALAVIAHCD